MKELEPEEKDPELSREEILKLNRIHHRFTRAQVEEYIERTHGERLPGYRTAFRGVGRGL